MEEKLQYKKLITKKLAHLVWKKKNVYSDNSNYLNGDYYAGLDVGFDYTMLERLRGGTEYTTTYSDST